MPFEYDKKAYKEFAERRDNKTIHYHKGHKIECRSILDYMGKSYDDFTLEDIYKWNLYLEALVPRKIKKKGDYKETFFYCIDVNGECYVGHTTNFKNRMLQHKNAVKSQGNNLYRALHNFGFENAIISILEIRCCKDRKDAISHEQKHFDRIKASLNMVPPSSIQPNPYHLW